MKFFLKYYKVLVPITLWLFFLFFSIRVFSQFIAFSDAIERGFLLIFLYVSIYYFNWFILVPRYYIKKKYLIFFAFIFILIIVSSFLRILIANHYELNLHTLNENPLIDSVVLKKAIGSFGISFFVLASSFLVRIADLYTKQVKQKELLIQQKTEAELTLLKAQLNPHFLFNALNNIYALVLTRSEFAADSLISLSQLLRYIIYDTSVEFVPLEKEIKYLKYYIELESLRLERKDNLDIKISEMDSNYYIMPMLFIPFVENGFKHSDINKDGKMKIHINMHKNELEFICENTYSLYEKNVDSVGGVGLTNSINRLDRMYHDRYNLEITDENEFFSVNLKIQL
ncbi:sensor histidine kinase [Salinivirga cyanobacteriivorans]